MGELIRLHKSWCLFITSPEGIGLRIHNLSVEELLTSLHTTKIGLTSVEANRRHVEFGPNAIREAKRKPLVLRFTQGFIHFFAIILWCGAALAFFAEWKSPGSGMGLLGFAILGVILINGIFSFWQEYKAEEAIAALKDLIPHMVKAFRDGELSQLQTSFLVPGDLISVEEGDFIPADCRLVEATGLRVNNATLTGESIPLSRIAEASGEEDTLHSKNVLLAGTSVIAGHGKAFVFSTGMRTEFGKIADLTQSAKEHLSPLQQEIIRLSRVIACIALSVGGLFFCVAQSIGIPFWTNIVFAVGIIVAQLALPEAIYGMLKRGLAKDPAQRFQTANEFKQAFLKISNATILPKVQYSFSGKCRLPVFFGMMAVLAWGIVSFFPDICAVAVRLAPREKGADFLRHQCDDSLQHNDSIAAAKYLKALMKLRDDDKYLLTLDELEMATLVSDAEASAHADKAFCIGLNLIAPGESNLDQQVRLVKAFYALWQRKPVFMRQQDMRRSLALLCARLIANKQMKY